MTVPFTSVTISKYDLALTVVCLDLLIAYIFLVSLYVLIFFEEKENYEINKEIISIEDFAVVVRNLPKKKIYKSLKLLKASIWNVVANAI